MGNKPLKQKLLQVINRIIKGGESPLFTIYLLLKNLFYLSIFSSQSSVPSHQLLDYTQFKNWRLVTGDWLHRLKAEHKVFVML